MIPSLSDPSSACPTNRTQATEAEHHYASRTAALNCAFQRITAITPMIEGPHLAKIESPCPAHEVTVSATKERHSQDL
jgi:hypothetical protein